MHSIRSESKQKPLSILFGLTLFSHLMLVGIATIHPIAKASTIPDYLLPPGEWHQLVVPGNSAEVTIENIFGDDLPPAEYNETWALFRWDAESGQYINPGLSGLLPVGSGFWIIQMTGSEVLLDATGVSSSPTQTSSACTSEDGCTEIPVISDSLLSRWNMLGSALPVTQNIGNVQLRTNAGSGVCSDGCSVSVAADNGLVDSRMLRFDATAEQYRDLTIEGELKIWQSIWIDANSTLGGSTAHYLFENNVVTSSDSVSDDFDGNGPLQGYTTNNADALPDVARKNGRYHAELLDNSNNITLHFNQSQGRLDAKRLSFPFDYIARNIGIGTLENSQVAPVPGENGVKSSPYMFAGIQVHAIDLEKRDSAHFVVGHRGSTVFTVEGKNTVNGDSRVNDAGDGVAPLGRADLRVVGNVDGSLTWYWQQPNPKPSTQSDDWIPYRGSGTFPGTQANFGSEVYVGLITYAYGSSNVPFVGTSDAVELVSD